MIYFPVTFSWKRLNLDQT